MSLDHLLKAALLSEDMLETRDSVKRQYGNEYAHKIIFAKDVVRDIAKRHGKSIMDAALHICNKAVEDGHSGAVGIVVAAAVELCEEADGKRSKCP